MGGERRVAALWLQNDIQNDSEVRGGTNRELSTLLNVFGEIPPHTHTGFDEAKRSAFFAALTLVHLTLPACQDTCDSHRTW